MTPLEPRVLAARAQDFHEGLREVSGLPARDLYFNKTTRIGKAVALATHLRGLNVVTSHEALVTTASLLGIGADELGTILGELQTIGFVRDLRRNGDVITRLELAIPELRNSYSELGQRLVDLKPSEHELAAIDLLQSTIEAPKNEARLWAKVGVEAKVRQIIKDVVGAGGLVNTYDGPRGTMLYTPLMVEEDPKKLLAFAQQFPEERVVQAFQQVQATQGLPESEIIASGNDVLVSAMTTGVLQPVLLDVPGLGATRFHFTPRGGLSAERRIILDKARTLLAGVRCGQRYASSTPIRQPSLLLRKMRDGVLKPHSDLATQYGLVVTKGMGTLTPVGSRWQFRLNQTPENLAAVDLAIEMLETGGTSTSNIDLEARELVSVSGRYRGPIPTRTRLKRESTSSNAAVADVFEQMEKLARGIDLRNE